MLIQMKRIPTIPRSDKVRNTRDTRDLVRTGSIDSVVLNMYPSYSMIYAGIISGIEACSARRRHGRGTLLDEFARSG